MPSTTSSTVSADFDSSTVMTPSLPTFSIASAIRLPIVLSLFDAMVATCAISFLSFVDLLSFFSSSVTASTAASMPRLRPIGLAPAVTFFRPSRKMDWTTTATVLAQSIFREGLKNVTAGANPMGLKRGIEAAVEAVTEELKKLSKSTKDKKEIAQVATIASNNDKTIGSLIAEAMEKVGKDGVITVEESKSADTVLDVVEGMQFDRG